MNQMAVFAATGVMLAVDRRWPSFVGLSLAPGWWQELFAGLAIGVGMIAIIAMTLRMFGLVIWHLQSPSLPHSLTLASLFLLAAAGEELLFRGYGFQRVIENIGRAPTLILLSVFFAAGHAHNPNTTWPGLANTVLVGLVFGFAYLRTGRLWLPIGWHWGWNLAEAGFGFAVSGLRMPEAPLAATVFGSPLWTGGAYGPEAGLPTTIALLAGLVLVLRWDYWRETAPTS